LASRSSWKSRPSLGTRPLNEPHSGGRHRFAPIVWPRLPFALHSLRETRHPSWPPDPRPAWKEQTGSAGKLGRPPPVVTHDHTDQPRKPRADALRNRERVLEAAKAVFSAGGPEASLEAVAKRAGVGIGTLYRHFPTREDLFEAVYRREVEQLSELAEHLCNAKDPVDALRRWLRSAVEFVATKKGMSAALALTYQSSSELAAFSMDRLTTAIGSLLDRAVAADEIRADISPEDMLRTTIMMCYMHDQPGWQSSVLRMPDVFVDGLRVQPGATIKPAAKAIKPVAKRRASAPSKVSSS